MPIEVRWRKKAYAQLQKLPSALADRIVGKIEQVKEFPEHFLERGNNYRKRHLEHIRRQFYILLET